MFFLLHKHIDDGVFDDFPKISKDFQNCSEGQTNVPEHFPRISENFEDVWRFPKTAEDFRGRPEDGSMISCEQSLVGSSETTKNYTITLKYYRVGQMQKIHKIVTKTITEDIFSLIDIYFKLPFLINWYFPKCTYEIIYW